MNEPYVHVGILFEPQIEFVLNGTYLHGDNPVEGKQTVTYDNGRILWNGRIYDELLFVPQEEATASFDLLDVTIGIGFHWERKEDQRFQGALKIIVENDKLTAIDILRVEDYLTSVISSEMSATASLELLKAHAVISRSWLLAQIEKDKKIKASHTVYTASEQADGEQIKWYDREDHTRFDVCADDHCQRYQGITRATNQSVAEAVKETRGQVLMYKHAICDARFSKCCGGVTEEFNYCWEDKKYPYLSAVRDLDTESPLPDLTKEEEAERWIRQRPESFCHTTDPKILSQILNNYDQETQDFYRWKVRYTQAELAELIVTHTKSNYGEILDLIPVERGKSGRISRLKIVGTLKTMIIGKELEIRRTLSPTHLFSSAFVVDKGPEVNGVPEWFELTGAGWGHGVGLCQIGAAVMGEKGYAYDQILLHYYQGAEIRKLY